MNDKDWLKKVSIAYEEYQSRYEPQSQVATFIDWLYQQYGIVVPKQND